jgi:hypothetical protein
LFALFTALNVLVNTMFAVVTVCPLLAESLSVLCVLLPVVGSAAPLLPGAERASPPMLLSWTWLISNPVAVADTFTTYVTWTLPPIPIDVPDVQLSCVVPVQVNPLSCAVVVLVLYVNPVGSVSVNPTVPLVAVPPPLLIVTT